MTSNEPGPSAPGGAEPDEPFRDPSHERSGPTVDAAVANAEEGSQAEGDHVPSGQAASGESRVEQMPDVVPDAGD
jgi:hypothetical protein